VDLVFSDLEMPERGGLALARSLRTSNATISLVAVTAHEADQVRERCRAQGFDRVVEKPLSTTDVHRLIDDLIPLSGVDSSEPPSAVAVDASPDLEDLLPDFLARRWAEVGQLRALAEDGDWESIRQIAHRVRGSGGAYGFMELTEHATTLGVAARGEDEASAGEVIDQIEAYLRALRIRFSDGKVRKVADFVGSVPER